MFIRKMIVITFISLLLSSNSIAGDESWSMRIDKQGIQVHTIATPGSKFLTFKGEGTVSASLNAVVYLMRDIENMKNWLHSSYDIRVLEEIDPATRLIYMKNKAPIVKDRELILTQRFVKLSDDIVVVELISKADALVKNDDYVRVPDFKGSWVLKRSDDKTTHVTYTGVGDPGGLLPAALSNFMVPDTPYQSIKKIRQQPLEKYNGDLGFLAGVEQAEMEETRQLVTGK